MDDDLEEELLAVAGRKRGRGHGSSDDEDDDDDDFGSDDEEAAPSKRPSDKKPRVPVQRRGSGKAPRVEQPEEDGGYGSDLYEDDDDRRKLEAMTELEREMILADRAEERDKERQRRQLLGQQKPGRDTEQHEVRLSSRRTKAVAETDSAIRKLSSKITAVREKKERAADSARKMRASAASSPRRATRSQKGKGKGRGSAAARDWSDSEEEYEADEDEEEDDDEDAADDGKDEEPEAEAGRDGAQSEDEEAEARSPVSNERRRAAEVVDDEVPAARLGTTTPLLADRHKPAMVDDDREFEHEDASYDEVKSIQLLRSQLEAWVNQPFFVGKAISGCVVRMAYGGMTRDPDTRQEVAQYLVMVVQDIKEGRAYPFGARGKMTTKHLVLKDGLGLVRTLAMSNISNSAFVEWEYTRYLRHCERSKEIPLNKQDVALGQSKIKDATNFRWDARTVQELVASKREAAAGTAKNFAAEKARLRLLRDNAHHLDRMEEVAQYEIAIRDLEARAIEDRNGGGRSFGMSHINKRNTTQNFQNTYRNVSNQVKGAPTLAGAGGHAVDAFSRRVTRPNIYWNTGSGAAANAAAAAEAGAAEGDAAMAETAVGALERTMSSKLKASELRMDPAELLQQLEIDIDIGRLQGPEAAPSLSKRLLGPRWQASLQTHTAMDLTNKLVLSLADWKRRVGMV